MDLKRKMAEGTGKALAVSLSLIIEMSDLEIESDLGNATTI